MKPIRRLLIIGYSPLLAATLSATAIMFPWSVDPHGDESFRQATINFYDEAYSTEPNSGNDDIYRESSERATLISKTPELVADFVAKYSLKNKKVLEVGAGSGQLQDIVDDYTALEISGSARRFFHKPFVEASATNMPFPDSTFDALWSFRVLEHIPNPERALQEMRRVVKPGGYILLNVGNDVDRYAGQGYRVRPYSDFGVWGRIKKATIPIADSRAFFNLYARQVRLLRSWVLGLEMDHRDFILLSWTRTTIPIGLAIATRAFQFPTTRSFSGSYLGGTIAIIARMSGT